MLHERHDRPPEGRRLLAPLDRAALARRLSPDAIGIRERDRVMPVVPMFHANAWGIPYAAALAGAKLVFPGPHMAPAELAELIAAERVTRTRRRADDLAGDAPARPAPDLLDPEGDQVRRLGRARGADARLRRALRRADRPGLGDDRDQPAGGDLAPARRRPL